MTEVQLEAIRIWQTVPGNQVYRELGKLPEYKVICGVRWPFRMAVEVWVDRAKAARGTIVTLPGMTAELRCVGVASSERGNGDAAAGYGVEVCPAQEAGHKD